MASNESIGSRLLKQPSPSSVKLPIYESLFQLNESIDHSIARLPGMKKLPFAENVSNVNADFTGKLEDSERFDEGRFWRQRREYEERWRDPDDVYVEVQWREEERKKQGFPSRLGVLPHPALADQEVEQEHQKSAPRKSSN